MKIKKGPVFLLLALLALGILIRYAFRDIKLDVDLLKESLERMPGLVLENLEFEREISGDLWQVQIPYAERQGDMIQVRSVDVRRWLADGKEWYFWGSQGIYRDDEGTADLTRLLGTMETDARVLNLESPHLLWNQADEEFFFPEGFILYDDEFILTAEVASIDDAGMILLDKGGTVKWMRNE